MSTKSYRHILARASARARYRASLMGSSPAHSENQARSLLYRLQLTASRLNSSSSARIHYCLRRVARGDSVGVVVSGDSGSRKARYTGLMTCRSVYECPVCSRRIAARRRRALRDAVDAASGRLFFAMLTFTFRHSRSDPLRVLLDSGRAAWQYFKSGYFWTSLAKRYSIAATLRAEEITWSTRSGWHVHYHVLLVFDRCLSGFEKASLQRESRDRWLEILPRFGLSALHSIGVRLTHSQASAVYAAKVQSWGAVEEVAYHRSKLSRHGSLVPFEILARAASDRKMRRLWREYVEATRGRRQLVSSRGFKALLGVDFDADVFSDDDADADAPYVFWLKSVEYALICRLGWRAVVLDAAEVSFQAFTAYLSFVRFYALMLTSSRARAPDRALLDAFPTRLPANGRDIAIDSSLAA